MCRWINPRQYCQNPFVQNHNKTQNVCIENECLPTDCVWNYVRGHITSCTITIHIAMWAFNGKPLHAIVTRNVCSTVITNTYFMRYAITRPACSYIWRSINGACYPYNGDNPTSHVLRGSNPSIVQSDLWDGQFIDVHGENLRGKLTIGDIYRPPRFNNNNSTL